MSEQLLDTVYCLNFKGKGANDVVVHEDIFQIWLDFTIETTKALAMIVAWAHLGCVRR